MKGNGFVKVIPLSDPEWLLEIGGFDRERQQQVETLFALSNGSFGVRGCLEEMPAGCLPGTFLAGVYDRDEFWTWDMVNLPNFLGLDISAGARKFGVETAQVLEHRRVLDMKQWFLYRDSALQDDAGNILRWQSYRVVSFADSRLCAELHVPTSRNFSGPLKVASLLDANVDNFDNWMFRKLKHLDMTTLTVKDGALLSFSKLKENRFPVVVGSRVAAAGRGHATFEQTDALGTAWLEFAAKPDVPIVLERFSTARVSRDRNADPDALFREVCGYLGKAAARGFGKALAAARKGMAARWAVAEIAIGNDAKLQRHIAYNLFHLIQAGPRHDERVSIGAKVLTGERYSGHIYWDTEIFMLPFFVFTDPDTARNILLYRYHMLPGARITAARYHQRGARYPYKSADLGVEAIPGFQPPVWCITKNDEIGVQKDWFGEKQIHIASAVAYGLWLYCQATGDEAFMARYGMEMLVEIARFWCSALEWNPKAKRYEILDVMGPDEFHERVNNNAYTNYMAGSNLGWALELVGRFQKRKPRALKRVKEKIGLTTREIGQWKAVRRRLYLPTPNADGIIEECDGFLQLKEFDKGDADIITSWGPVPNACGGTVLERSPYQAVKQCDLVLLFFLFPDLFDAKTVERNFDFYERKTYHLSSLSPNTASVVALRLNKGTSAYKHLNASSVIDLEDIQGNTAHGIHSAAAAGTWMAAVYGAGGLTISKDFELDPWPRLLDQWTSFTFRFWWQRSLIQVSYDGTAVSLRLLRGKPARIKVRGQGGSAEWRKSLDMPDLTMYYGHMIRRSDHEDADQ